MVFMNTKYTADSEALLQHDGLAVMGFFVSVSLHTCFDLILVSSRPISSHSSALLIF